MALPMALLAVAGGAQLGQTIMAHRSAQAQKEGQRIQGAEQTVEANRQKKAAARRARIRRAQMMQQSTHSGTRGSSGEQSVIGGISASLAEGHSRLLGGKVTADALTRQGRKAASAQRMGQVFGQIGQMAMMGSQVAGQTTPQTTTPVDARPINQWGGTRDVFGGG